MKNIFVMVLLVSSVSRGQGIPDGVYHYDGVTCEKENDFGVEGLRANEDIRFGNLVGLVEVSKDKVTSRTRKFSFDRYGSDFCEMKSLRSLKFTNKSVEFSEGNREFAPSGKYGHLGCRATDPKQNAITFLFRTHGSRLYLTDSAKGPSPDGLCRSGPSFYVYSRAESAQFPAVTRPSVGPQETKILSEIKKHPKSELAQTDYILFLLQERRITEASAQNLKLKALNPKSSQAKTIDLWIAEYSGEKDPTKADKTLSSHLIDHAMDGVQQAMKPLQAAKGQFEKMAEKVANTPKATPLTQQQRQEMMKTPEGVEMLKLMDELNQNVSEVQQAFDPKAIAKDREDREAAHKQQVENFKQRFKASAGKQYGPSPKELLAANSEKGNSDKAAGAKAMAKAFKDFPNSPFILQEYIIQLLRADQGTQAFNVYDVESGKYKDQVNIQIMGDWMPRLSRESDPSQRIQLRMRMQEDLMAADEAMRALSAPAKK